MVVLRRGRQVWVQYDADVRGRKTPCASMTYAAYLTRLGTT
jgi:hypothetical protein